MPPLGLVTTTTGRRLRMWLGALSMMSASIMAFSLCKHSVRLSSDILWKVEYVALMVSVSAGMWRRTRSRRDFSSG